jgi:hypothetical protein
MGAKALIGFPFKFKIMNTNKYLFQRHNLKTQIALEFNNIINLSD